MYEASDQTIKKAKNEPLLMQPKQALASFAEHTHIKDADDEAQEMRRASEGINRKNKKIVKTIKTSDVLIIEKEDVQPDVESWEDLFDERGSLKEFSQQVFLIITFTIC